MRLKLYTDYGLRTLITLALAPAQPQTAASISAAHGISRHHLVKIMARLAELGYVSTARGKGGGVRLARPAEQISIGQVVRDLEEDPGVLPCMNEETIHCVVAPACQLRGFLGEATAAFFSTLDRYTLKDAVRQRAPMARLLGIPIHTVPAAAS
jgi:Rrf2 family nitric oxide-sensitive transcriptional repressor